MKDRASLVEISTLQSMIARRCAGLGLSATFDPGAKTALTTENTITFPTPRLPITKDELDLLYGYMIHETGHHTRREAFDILRSLETVGQAGDSPLPVIFGMVEDHAMEREISRYYMGDRKALGKGMLNHIKRQIAYRKTWTKEQINHESVVKGGAAYYICYKAREDWDDISNAIDEDLYESLNSSQELIDDLLKEGWVDRIRAAETPKEAFKAANELFVRLFPEQQDLSNKAQEAVDNEAGGKGKQGEQGNGDTPGKDGGKEQGGEGAGQGDAGDNDQDSGSKNDSEVVYDWKHWHHTDHKEHVKDKGRCARPDWTGHKQSRDQVMLMPDDKINVMKAKEARTSEYPMNMENTAALANNIRIYIQATSRRKHTPEQYRGKIDKRSISRLAFPPIDGGDWNKRIFYTETKKKYKNTAVAILTDWSGSMIGRKMKIAAQATARLTDVFDRQLHVPVYVSAFSSSYNTVPIAVIKDFNEKLYDPQAIGRRFTWFNSYSSGNADADAVAYVYKQLAVRREERKILIVLSDGSPTCSAIGANPDSTLKYIIQDIEAIPNVDVLGIGVCSDQVQRYYSNHRVINDVNQLDRALLEVLKEVYVHE